MLYCVQFEEERTMKRLLYLLIGLLAAVAAAAQTGSPPHMTIIVGGPPGTPGDIVARVLSDPLGKELGQPIVVENRPGAAGSIALGAVRRATADGNTLGVFALQSTVAAHTVKSLPYDTARDLAPVRQISTVANVLVVRSEGTAVEFADLLRRDPQSRLAYASGGTGTPSHLAAELFAQHVKTQIRHVPFNGPIAALTALAGGHVDAMFATAPASLPLIKGGKLRPLAVTSPQRLPTLPDVPTLVELGYADASLVDWHGLVAPAGTPPERIEQISTAIGKVLADESVRQRLQSAGVQPVGASGPPAFRSFVDDETRRWTEVLRRGGISLQ
ncbi:Argininosuccinate lyase [Variovorax sp. RA8]|nr:Argininosuccinate lyase [Variovorax sp. RA8]